MLNKMKFNHSWSKISTAVLLALGGAGLASLAHSSTANASHVSPRVTAKNRHNRRMPVKLINHNKLHKVTRRVRHAKNNYSNNLKELQNAKRIHMNAIRKYNNTPSKRIPRKNASSNNTTLFAHNGYNQFHNHQVRRVAPKQNNQSIRHNNTRRKTVSRRKTSPQLKQVNSKLSQVQAQLDQASQPQADGDTITVSTPRLKSNHRNSYNPNGYGTGKLTYGRKYERFAFKLKHVPFRNLTSMIKHQTNKNVWSHYYANLNKNDLAAKLMIATGESMGHYHITNGEAFGRFQLKHFSYIGHRSLHYIYSHPAYQERSATRYMQTRYRTWHRAGNFWMAHHWW